MNTTLKQERITLESRLENFENSHYNLIKKGLVEEGIYQNSCMKVLKARETLALVCEKLEDPMSILIPNSRDTLRCHSNYPLR